MLAGVPGCREPRAGLRWGALASVGVVTVATSLLVPTGPSPGRRRERGTARPWELGDLDRNVRDGYRKRRPQLSEQAADYVRDLIIYGDLRPGQFIRLEDMAERFGSSVTPVREALLTLRQEGFVEFAPHRGFTVAPFTVDDLRDVFALQAFVAGELTARAAAVATEDDLERLELVQLDLERAAERNSAADVEHHNNEFHRIINGAAAAPKLAQFLLMALRYVPRRFFTTISGWQSEATSEHRTILAGLRARDAEAARRAMERHVSRAGEILALQLQQRADESAWRPASSLPDGSYRPSGEFP